MTKPVAYGIDVHTAPEKVGSGRMPNRVWADTLLLERGHFCPDPCNVSLHQIVNTETRDGAGVPVEEHMLSRSASLNGREQFVDGLRPKRAAAQLVAFSTDADPRDVAVGDMGKVEISHQDLGSFIRPRAGVVKEQEKDVIASALRALDVGSRKERIDLGLLQIGYGCLSALLEGYGADLSTPSEMLGAMEAHKTGQ